jgi:mannose-6-phosphate isomerase-like protein (cupin superfamily)
VTIIEYSGLATTGESECSWAIAKFEPNGASVCHYHQDRTETFYIIAGKALIRINEQEHLLTAGEHIIISPGQYHQVKNISENEPMVLIENCKPAWSHQDMHLELEIMQNVSS